MPSCECVMSVCIRASDKTGSAIFPPGAWAGHASELARWAWERLVNRTDARGGYRPLRERGREYTRRDGTKARLGKSTTRKGQLTAELLARHFRATAPEHVVGLHTT